MACRKPTEDKSSRCPYTRQRIPISIIVVFGQVTLVQEHHVLKGVSYKSGQIPAMLIDKATREEKWEGPSTGASPSPSAAAPTPKADVAVAEEKKETNSGGNISAAPSASPEEVQPQPVKPAAHSTTVKTPAIRKGFLQNSKHDPIYPAGSSEGGPGKTAPPQNSLISEIEPGSRPPASEPKRPKDTRGPVVDSSNPVSDLKEKVTVRKTAVESESTSADPGSEKAPVFRIKERGIISMGDFDGVSQSAMLVASNRPAELVVTIELPKVTKASKVQLDVSER
jgi:hypothetical protein